MPSCQPSEVIGPELASAEFCRRHRADHPSRWAAQTRSGCPNATVTRSVSRSDRRTTSFPPRRTAPGKVARRGVRREIVGLTFTMHSRHGQAAGEGVHVPAKSSLIIRRTPEAGNARAGRCRRWSSGRRGRGRFARRHQQGGNLPGLSWGGGPPDGASVGGWAARPRSCRSLAGSRTPTSGRGWLRSSFRNAQQRLVRQGSPAFAPWRSQAFFVNGVHIQYRWPD